LEIEILFIVMVMVMGIDEGEVIGCAAHGAAGEAGRDLCSVMVS
jgi:hypothetical protein